MEMYLNLIRSHCINNGHKKANGKKHQTSCDGVKNSVQNGHDITYL